MSRHSLEEMEREVGTQTAPYNTRDPTSPLWVSTKGRISRSTFFLKFMLPIAAITLVARAIDVDAGLSQWGETGPVEAVAALLLFWPIVAGTVKRLHDLDHPGKWVAEYWGSYVLCILVALSGNAILMLLALNMLLVLIVVGLWFGVKLLLYPGTPGPNRYGEDPLEPSTT